MGCCASTPSTTSPYPDAEPSSSSSRAINNIISSQPASHAALPRPSTTHTIDSSSLRQSTTANTGPAARAGAGAGVAPSTTAQGQGSHEHKPQRPLSEHFTKPLKLHVWSSTDKIWTRREIDREREAFFDTRVSGRQEIWMTIRATLEVLWSSSSTGAVREGEAERERRLEDGDHNNIEEDIGESDNEGIMTAQSILEAAGITIPTGDLANGVYDAFGAFYSLPEWVVSDPDNLLVNSGETEDKSLEGGSVGSQEESEEELLRRREEKGKAVIAEADLIHVKARLSDRGGPDVTVMVGKEDSVRLLARRVFEEADLAPPQRVRICYMGKMLKESESLLAQGWKDDHIVNALVFNGFES